MNITFSFKATLAGYGLNMEYETFALETEIHSFINRKQTTQSIY